MKTVCFCNSTLFWGGGEKWHLDAACSFARRGWRVLLLCHPRGALYRRAVALDGVQAVPIPLGRFSFFNPFTGLRLLRFFRTERVQAVIMNLPSDLKAAGPAARAAGVRHVIYRRGSALPVRDSWLNRRLYGSVITRLLVNSRATMAQALVNNPALIPTERISILPNGVDIAAFDLALAVARKTGGGNGPPVLTPGPVTAEDGKNHDRASCRTPFVIGNAGRLNRQKGQHLLLHLGRRLVDAGLDLRLVIAGAGERDAELKALAAALGLEDRTTFCGFMEQLAPFWLAIDLFVLTSLWEGFGNVIIEAGLAHKPVFAFDVSNLPELIREGKNGRLFPLPQEEAGNCPDACQKGKSGDPGQNSDQSRAKLYAGLDSMVDGILEIANDREALRRMGLAGRTAAEAYSQQTCMDALENLLGVDVE